MSRGRGDWLKVIVVGTGAGGATAARELVAKGADVVVLEAGRPFKPLTRKIQWTDSLRRTGLLGSERTISRLFPHMQTTRSKELLLVRGMTTGGSTTISCGNMVRAERGLREIGLDLSEEFGELERLIGISTIPRDRWRPITARMFDAAERLGLDPRPTPKAVDSAKCVSCGLCEVGCASGARWDSRRFLQQVVKGGGTVRTESPVAKVVVEDKRVTEVIVDRKGSIERYKADVVVLAAGGIGTAQILRSSGLPASETLWADIVLTMGGRLEGARQLEEQPMAWYAQREHYILSPYIDILSHWFHKPWRKVPIGDRVGMMVKLQDAANGSVTEKGEVLKRLTVEDMERLDAGMALTKEVMESAGAKGPFVEGMLNGGHLGGTVPLRREEVESMHPSSLPANLYVADLSLVPRSQGLPTMLVTAALALRVSRKIARAQEQH